MKYTSFLYRLLFAATVGFVTYPILANADLSVPLPHKGIIQADLVSLDTFDVDNTWEQYSGPGGAELGAENGVYRAYTINAGYVWGLNQVRHSDVILEVDATPLTNHYENGLGILCRADTSSNGDGYYFMVTGNGYYSIRIGQGNEVRALVDWQQSNAIHREIDTNHLQAVCVDDYLAFYVNDELVATAFDDTYKTGYAGISVAAAVNSDIDVAFDNFSIYQIMQP